MSSLPLYFPAGYDREQALRCAVLVGHAYDMHSQWHRQGSPSRPRAFAWAAPVPAGWQFSAPIWSVLSGLPYLSEAEPFGFAARDPQGAVYLVFRGTDTLPDWRDDFAADPSHYPWQQRVGLIHDGFLKLYRSLRQHALQALDDLRPGGALLTCGHSLGCSLSTLAVLDIREQWPDQPLEQYNFASPRLGDPAFAAFYNALRIPTYRLVNDSDEVPQTPPAARRGRYFQHVGWPVTFSASYPGEALAHSLADCYLYALEHPDAPMRGC
ncbi:lipase family protein [Pseudomonas sp. RIT-PI-AD]|uniref:lipase family protein n=1 Tax=Pseudomonas sp. RIT-PI-AD TaxID=3035294 RepID=UPI0021D969CB|nr:lipase family protein [Pseudomonas sp. RIT-PI-AD]